MAVREYYVEVSFTEDLSAEVKAELTGWIPDGYVAFWGLSWDCAANDGKGGFVKDNALIESQDLHSGQYLHDEAEALKAFRTGEKRVRVEKRAED